MKVERLPIRNASPKCLAVDIEPWGERFQLEPNKALEAILYGPEAGQLEVAVGEQIITLYGWECSEYLILKDRVCLEQPRLTSVIRELSAIHGVTTADLDLHPQEVEHAQEYFDTFVVWNDEGAEAAEKVAFWLAPSLRTAGKTEFVLDFVRTILRLRGVFPDSGDVWSDRIYADLVDAITESQPDESTGATAPNDSGGQSSRSL